MLIPLVVAVIIATIFLFNGIQHSQTFGPSTVAPVALMFAWLGLVSWMSRDIRKWRRVRLGVDRLYVSGSGTQMDLAFDQIASVSERRRLKNRTIEIRLKSTSPFGDTISYNPKPTWRYGDTHPDVAELSAYALGGRPTEEQLRKGANNDRLQLIALVVLPPALAISGLSVVQWTFHNARPYGLALTQMESDARVLAVLGPHIRPGHFVGGALSTSGDSGCASLSFGLHGDLAGGHAHVRAVKASGEWTITSLWLQTDDGQRVNLVASQQPAVYPCSRQR